jgi:hypothetical protein
MTGRGNVPVVLGATDFRETARGGRGVDGRGQNATGAFCQDACRWLAFDGPNVGSLAGDQSTGKKG